VCALRFRGRLGAEVDRRAVEQRVEHGRIDEPRAALDDGFGEQVLARDRLERLGRDRRRAGGGHELRALHRHAEQVLLELVLVLQVHLLAPLLRPVQRRLRDVDVAALDQLGHLAVEERQQQRADVRAVDVRVRHDDDAVVAELVGVERVLVFLVGRGLAEPRAERGDQRHDLLAGDHLVETRALDVQDLAAQRQDRLELAVAPCFADPPAESPSTR
jgi:hypothetical protein